MTYKVIHSTENSTTCEVIVNNEGVLAPFLTEQQTLPAWYFVEIMAQTVGVWNGLRLEKIQSTPKIALLLGVRRFHSEISEAKVSDRIISQADMVLFDENLSSFQCSLFIDDTKIATSSIVAYEATQQQLELFKEKGSSL